jgi:copper chaperone CopZ
MDCILFHWPAKVRRCDGFQPDAQARLQGEWKRGIARETGQQFAIALRRIIAIFTLFERNQIHPTMKKQTLFFLLPLFMLACQSNPTQNQDESTSLTEEEAALPENLSILVLDVHGMTCNGCEQSVQKSLLALPGVYLAEASHVDSMAIVQFDPGQASVEAIQNAINETGYEVVGFHFQEEEVIETPDTAVTE